MRQKLQERFEKRRWLQGENVSRSGQGSSMKWTKRIRENLPRIFKEYNVSTFLDAPCGDWFWMQHVNLSAITYIGGDISGEIIQDLKEKFEIPNVSFQHLDITSDPLPKVDMMMCRDCLFHLKYDLRWAFLRNFLKSDIPYLLTTINYPKENVDLRSNGGWKPFNPMLPPFSFPEPIELIHETADDLPSQWQDIHESADAKRHRSLGIWTKQDITNVVNSNAPKDTIIS
jgi:hypothetical protein